MDLKNKKLILASNSPRRKEILKNAGYDFIVVPSQFEENISGEFFTCRLVENCAYNKALDVYNKINDKNSVFLSADTVVVMDSYIIGKPKDEEDAFLMLKRLSNRTHMVATSICILYNGESIKDTQLSYVAFRELSDKEIKDYIENKNPLDKAGSYGIQDENFDFAVKIAGEFNNIVGFPLILFENKLKQLV